MKCYFPILSAFSIIGSAVAQQFIVNTPIGGVLQCVPIEIVWQGGTGPFDLIFTSNVTDPLQIYRKLKESPFLWPANVSSGTRLVMSLLDETNGNEAISGNFSVSDSGNSSCLHDNSSKSSATPSSESGTTLEGHSSSSSIPVTATTDARSGSSTASFPIINGGTSAMGPAITASLGDNPAHRVRAAAIGGIVAGIVVLILILMTTLFLLYKRRQRRGKELALEITAHPYHTTAGETQMLEDSSGIRYSLTRERLAALGGFKSQFRESSPTLQQSQSPPVDMSDNDESNPDPDPMMPSNAVPAQVVRRSLQERAPGSDITMVERVTRAVLLGLPLRRMITREEEPPRYEE